MHAALWFPLLQGVCVRDGLLFVADAVNNRVAVFAAEDGRHVAHIACTATMQSPRGIATSDDGVLYVTVSRVSDGNSGDDNSPGWGVVSIVLY